MSKNKVPVSVIVVNYKTKDYTLSALRALFASSVLPEQVILVDNNSQDGSLEAIQAAFPDIEYIANTVNTGFARANNQAIRDLATEPFIWLLNSDTETGRQSLEQLYTYIKSHPKVGAVGPQLVYPTGAFQSIGGYFPTPSNVLRYLIPFGWFLPVAVKRKLKNIALFPQPVPTDGIRLDYVTGAASLLRKQALDEVGLLAEDYFMYFEETDLCYRLKWAGWDIIAIDTEPVMHVYGGSFKTKYDKRRLGIFLESLIIFAKKHYTGWKKWAIIAEVKLFGPISLVLKRVKNVL